MRNVLRSWVVGVALFLLFACGGNTTQVPSRLLQPDSMKVVLHELFLADALNGERVNRLPGLDRGLENKKYYQRIFELHNIDYEKFNESLQYYLDHPVLFNALTDSLSAYSGRISSLNPPPPPTEKIQYGNHFKDSARSIRDKFFRR